MKGGYVPYFLRPNKAVDRELFVELLEKCSSELPIQSYRYVGFGGPFLEDFRRIHSSLAIAEMISLEADPAVISRQRLNLPYACVSCEQETAGDFLQRDSWQDRTVLWLDYSEPEEIGDQIGEFRLALMKLRPDDFLRITINADINSFAKDDEPKRTGESDQGRILRVLEKRVGDSLPAGLTAGDMVANRIPRILLGSLQNVVSEERAPFLPLLITSYADKQTMLTVTGILTEDKADGVGALSKTLGQWPYYSRGWDEIIDIDLPLLSVKERLAIDEKLPEGTPPEVKLHEDDARSETLMEHYKRFYRYYPQYSRVVV